MNEYDDEPSVIGGVHHPLPMPEMVLTPNEFTEVLGISNDPVKMALRTTRLLNHDKEQRKRLLAAELELKTLQDTLNTYWVNNVNKLRAEHKALLSVLERSEEYIVCLNDQTAMAYDGATTRTVWRQAVEKARATLNA